MKSGRLSTPRTSIGAMKCSHSSDECYIILSEDSHVGHDAPSPHESALRPKRGANHISVVFDDFPMATIVPQVKSSKRMLPLLTPRLGRKADSWGNRAAPMSKSSKRMLPLLTPRLGRKADSWGCPIKLLTNFNARNAKNILILYCKTENLYPEG